MRSLNKNKSVLVWFLVLVLIFQFVFSSFTMTAHATSTGVRETSVDRIQNSINLAKGKTITELDVNSLTTEDLQVIGVFLSNFYEPWGTEILETTDNGESIKEQQVEALVDMCSFDEELATKLVEKCWDMSVDSAKPLYIGQISGDTVSPVHAKIERDGTFYYGVCDGTSCPKDASGNNIDHTKEDFDSENIFAENGNCIATYFSFMDWFSGLQTAGGTKEKFAKNFLKGKKLCLYWDDNGTKKPVFDTKAASNDNTSNGDLGVQMRFTASSAMYALINDELSYKTGVGSALIDCTLDEFNANQNIANELIVLNSRLYVDCFGNLLVDTGTSKYVMFPACANPYAWSTDINGSDIGENINTVNLFCLGEAQDGRITAKTNSNSEAGVLPYKYTFYGYLGNQSLFNINYWRLNRGEDKTEVDLSSTSWWSKMFNGDDLGDGGDIFNAFRDYAYDETSANSFIFPSWGAYRITTKNKDGNTVSLSGLEAAEVKNYKKDYYAPIYTTSKLITDFIQIDDLNAFKKSSEDYKVFNTFSGGIFEKDGDTYKALDYNTNKFKSPTEIGKITKLSGIEAKKYLTGIYCSYVLAYFNKGEDEYPVSYYYAKESFPSISDVDFDWGNIEVSADTKKEEILSWVYYLLHPTEGLSYIATWFKNKVSGILVGWHEDMVGSSGGAGTTGSTRYLGFSGYVTLPSLYDMKWTAWLLEEYNNIVVYLIIIIIVILVSYCILGEMTFQRAIIGVFLFGVLAFFPPICINTIVDTINSTCNSIYGDKFTYWAIVQHATYLSDLQSAIESSDPDGNQDSYLSFRFSNQDSVDSEDDSNAYTKVRLKWLSPKKINVESDAVDSLNDSTNSSGVSRLLGGLIRSQLSGEDYVASNNATYLYRDYADLYAYSSYAYNTDEWYDNKKLLVEETDFAIFNKSNRPAISEDYSLKYSNSDVDMWKIYNHKTYDSNKECSTPYWMYNGFTVNTGGAKDYNSKTAYNNRSYTFLLDSMVYGQVTRNNKPLLSSKTSDLSDSLSKKLSGIKDNNLTINLKDIDSSLYGLSSDKYNLTLADLNAGVDLSSIKSGVASTKIATSGVGNFYYALYTESPFYFFTWNILDQQNSTEFKSVCDNAETNEELLDMYTTNNQQYFYNYSENAGNGYGEMRDYCNMHGLFYYVIPYLRACNKGILEWSEKYGTFTYEDVKVEYKNGVAINIPTAEDTDEYIYKWWHNYNVDRLFNTYTPWVDLMYDCDYADSETISVAGEKYLVVDPLDPMSYCKIDSQGRITEGRAMIFSRSEMKYYGLEMRDLTKVEQKIIEIQDTVYKDLLQLMDYYNLNSSVDMNEVLTTSAGMLTTFTFNKEFSQVSAVSENYVLYPQSYELKAFSYDAYLRLILAGSVDDDLLDTSNNASETSSYGKSFYLRVVENSSITLCICYIILDILAVYAVPALKLFFLIVIFFMSVLMIVASAIKLEMNIVKTTWDALVSPLLKFGTVSIGLAWLVSMFMSDGNTDVTGRGGFTISLDDPTMVVLVMIIINAGVLILYYRICKKSFSTLIDFAKALGTSMSGVIGGTLGKLAGHVIGGKQMVNAVAKGTAKARGMLNKPRVNTASAGVAGAVGGATTAKTFSSKTRDDSAKVSKSKDEKLNKLNNRYDKLSGEKSKVKSAESKEKAEGFKNKFQEKSAERQSVLDMIEVKRRSGQKLTLRERTYSARSAIALTGTRLNVKNNIGSAYYSAKGAVYSIKSNVENNVNEKLGRKRRAKAKVDIREAQLAGRNSYLNVKKGK